MRACWWAAAVGLAACTDPAPAFDGAVVGETPRYQAVAMECRLTGDVLEVRLRANLEPDEGRIDSEIGYHIGVVLAAHAADGEPRSFAGEMQLAASLCFGYAIDPLDVTMVYVRGDETDPAIGRVTYGRSSILCELERDFVFRGMLEVRTAASSCSGSIDLHADVPGDPIPLRFPFEASISR